MRTLILIATAASALVPFSAAASAPTVDMFGAAWCGPCRYLRAVLDHHRIRYRYHDVDSPSGRAAYVAARGPHRGIPLLIVGGRRRIVGADLAALGRAVGKKLDPPAAPRRGAGPARKLYGGRPAGWWQAQFRSIRQHLARLDAAIERLAAVAADHVERAQLEKLRESREVVQASIYQLENDASRAALPRKYRR